VIFIEPTTKRAVASVDGQNLYHAARKAFGYSHPNYDVSEIAQLIETKLVRVTFFQVVSRGQGA
jgi:hypothetical protein